MNHDSSWYTNCPDCRLGFPVSFFRSVQTRVSVAILDREESSLSFRLVERCVPKSCGDSSQCYVDGHEKSPVLLTVRLDPTIVEPRRERATNNDSCSHHGEWLHVGFGNPALVGEGSRGVVGSNGNVVNVAELYPGGCVVLYHSWSLSKVDSDSGDDDR